MLKSSIKAVLKPRLAGRIFLIFTSSVIVLGITLNLLTVPWIRGSLQESGYKNAETILVGAYDLIESQHNAYLDDKNHMLDERKLFLKNLVETVVANLDRLNNKVKSGQLSFVEAKKEGVEFVSTSIYQNNDYFFALNYDSIVVAHPDTALVGTETGATTDVKGKPFSALMIELAKKESEGYLTYWWPKLGDKEASHKLTYVQNYEPWEWVVGTGVFIDDIEKLFLLKEEQMIKRISKSFGRIKIGRNGYLFVLDGDGKPLIHPDIDKLVASVKIKPDNISESVFEKIKKAKGGKVLKISYKWNVPGDLGNYIYDKIAWVTHFDELDWYIVATAYPDDLVVAADELAKRILMIFLIALLFAIGGGYFFSRWLSKPIYNLALQAERVGNGNLSVRAQSDRSDELGFLTESFNDMTEKLKDHVDHLEQKVAERTIEISKWAKKQEKRKRESDLIRKMLRLIQGVEESQEAYKILSSIYGDIFPGKSGAIYIADENNQTLVKRVQFGPQLPALKETLVDYGCAALKVKRTHVESGSNSVCEEPGCTEPGKTNICTLLTAYGSMLGVAKIFIDKDSSGGDGSKNISAVKELLEETTDHAALSISDLQMRRSLRDQTLTDSLTGLHNRRYIDTILETEILRAKRENSMITLIMVDIDHFKRFNDTYGHDAGDFVLKRVAEIFKFNIRTYDIACRYGGEEFLIAVMGTSKKSGVEKAEELRELIETNEFPKYYGKQLPNVTISAGVAVYPLHGEDLREIITTADRALYSAKGQNRNCVVMANKKNAA